MIRRSGSLLAIGAALVVLATSALSLLFVTLTFGRAVRGEMLREEQRIRAQADSTLIQASFMVGRLEAGVLRLMELEQ